MGSVSDVIYDFQIAKVKDLDHKEPVATSTEGLGNITLSGEQTLNGVTTILSRVMVMEQTAGEDNGIYDTGPGAWTRSEDADSNAKVTNGLTVWVDDSASTVFGDQYLLTTQNPIVLGTTSLTFSTIPKLGSHAIGGPEHTPSTLAELNNKVSDATLVGNVSPTFITDITTPLVIGGTSTTSDLSFKTTSGVGAAGADMHFLVGNNGATEAMTILNNGRIGMGTLAPNADLDARGTPGAVVGGFASGGMHITSPSAVEFTNAVITGHNLFSGNTQLWYLGSVSGSNNDIGFINRQNAAISFLTNNVERLKITAAGLVQIDNLQLDGNTISVTNLDGDLILDAFAAGTGVVKVTDQLEIEGSTSQLLLTDTDNAKTYILKNNLSDFSIVEIGGNNSFKIKSGAAVNSLEINSTEVTIGTNLLVDGTFTISDKYAIGSAFTDAGINSLIDSLGAEAGMGILPEGTYTMTGAATIDQNNTVLRGTGWGTILDGSAFVGSINYIDLTGGQDQCVISDMKFLGNDGGSDTEKFINATGCDHLRIYDNLFVDSDFDAVALNSPCNEFRVVNNFSLNTDTIGFRFSSSSDGLFLGNTMSTDSTGANFNSGCVNDIIAFNFSLSCGTGMILNNDKSIIMGNFGASNTTGISTTLIQDVVFIGNKQVSPAGTGFNVSGGNNNVFVGNSVNLGAQRGFNFSGTTNNVIMGNMVNRAGNGFDDFVIDASDKNVFIGNVGLDAAGKGERGLLLNDSDSNIIMGQHFSVHDTAGIALTGTSDNNIIMFNHLDGELVARITDTTGLSNNIIWDADTLNMIVTTNTDLGIADGKFIGLASDKGRIVFADDTTDVISFTDANVGIGTTTPGTLLQVAGLTTIGSGVPPNHVILADAVFMNSTNIGIDKLVVFGSDAVVGLEKSPHIVIHNENQTTDNNGIIVWTSDNTTNNEMAYAGIVGIAGARTATFFPGELAFHTRANLSGALSERMRIDSSGNVGIGTVAPLSGVGRVLHISETSTTQGANLVLERVDASVTAGNPIGSVLFLGGEDGTEEAVGSLIVQADEAWTPTSSGSRMLFSTTLSGTTNDTERIRIDSLGNVGIGTSAGAARLSINGGVHIGGDSDPGDNNLLVDGNVTVPLVIGGTSTTADLSFKTTSGVGIASADMHFLVGNNGATEAMTILNNGRVGIGTIAPNAGLDTRGAAGASVGGFPSGGLHVTGPSAAEFANAVITGHNLFSGNKQLWYLGSTSSSSDNVAFINRQNASLSLSTNSTTRLTILSGGDVGIGTSAPAEKLEVASPSGNVVIRIDAEGGATDEAQLDLVSGATSTKLFYRDSDDTFGIFHKDITRIRIQSNGTILLNEDDKNIGMGITGSPLAKLHVDQANAAGVKPVLFLDQADVSEEMIEFNTTIGVGNAIEAIGAKTLTTTHFVKVSIPGGLTRYIPVGTIA